MILLFGGTADTVPIANSLAERGAEVLISTLTSELSLRNLDPLVATRSGELDEEGIIKLLENMSVRRVVDSTHPYATQIQKNICNACKKLNIPVFRYQRPETEFEYSNVYRAYDHTEAALLAKRISRRPLLTIGSNNLRYYTKIFKCRKNFFARVLNTKDSIEKALKAKVFPSNIIPARGPFSLEDNVDLLKRLDADLLITKDGGEKANVLEKINAAKFLGIPILLVARPAVETESKVFYSYDQLLENAMN